MWPSGINEADGQYHPDIFPVVDDNNRMHGILNAHNVRKALYDKSISALVIAEDLKEKPFICAKTSTYTMPLSFFYATVCNKWLYSVRKGSSGTSPAQRYLSGL